MCAAFHLVYRAFFVKTPLAGVHLAFGLFHCLISDQPLNANSDWVGLGRNCHQFSNSGDFYALSQAQLSITVSAIQGF